MSDDYYLLDKTLALDLAAALFSNALPLDDSLKLALLPKPLWNNVKAFINQ